MFLTTLIKASSEDLSISDELLSLELQVVNLSDKFNEQAQKSATKYINQNFEKRIKNEKIIDLGTYTKRIKLQLEIEYFVKKAINSTHFYYTGSVSSNFISFQMLKKAFIESIKKPGNWFENIKQSKAIVESDPACKIELEVKTTADGKAFNCIHVSPFEINLLKIDEPINSEIYKKTVPEIATTKKRKAKHFQKIDIREPKKCAKTIQNSYVSTGKKPPAVKKLTDLDKDWYKLLNSIPNLRQVTPKNLAEIPNAPRINIRKAQIWNT